MIKFIKTHLAIRSYTMYKLNKPAKYDIVKDDVIVGRISGQYWVVTVLGAEVGTQAYLKLPSYVTGCQGKFKYAKLAAVEYFKT